jgi:geranylgeranyl pyrophosphate synthase
VSLEQFLEESRRRIDEALDDFLPAAALPPAVLHEAMRYAVFSGGKRLRPAIAFASARACGAADDVALPAAIAVELVHAYSLVHDDLPAMDDAEERRGRPCVHVKFGEANAVLVGDALIPAAFAAVAESPGAVAALARASGSAALVGGQADDLGLHRESVSVEEIVSIHERKTAALFRFAARGAGLLCGATEAECEQLDRFGLHYGLAFQATDDLLDDDPGECSILLVLPEAAARAHAEEQVQRALESLEPFGSRAEQLRALALQVAGRVT